MKNFVFLSPNFPTNYWKFCKELKENGMRVLGIGDEPYEQLDENVKNSLHEYYKVGSLENYDEVYRAVAFFAFKYGRIDWLESNNEYWLEQDAKLRADFNITTGFQVQDMPRMKYKSKMKEAYKEAGLAVARYTLVESLEGCRRFVAEAGYPVVAKPDNGVGASHNFKITNDEELAAFYKQRHEGVVYIMEEFVNGEVCSYDAIIDSKGNILFETGNVTPGSIMDMVNQSDDCKFYIVKDLPEDTKRAGRATVQAFGVKSRFVHFEFFRLRQDQKGLGRRGEIMALEVNMRPCGGFGPDMMDYANSTDVYKIWADMIAFDRSTKSEGAHAFCAYVGRRDGKQYQLSHEEILSRYGDAVRMSGRLPDALSVAMGNQFYMATFPEMAEVEAFFAAVSALV